GLLVAAALSDVYGRKPITLAGLISSIVGNLIILLSSTSVTMLYTGRLFAGLAVGIGMSVGTSWFKVLSTRHYDPKSPAAAGSRGRSLAVSVGCGCGEAVTGALAHAAPTQPVGPLIVRLIVLALTIIPTALAAESVAATPAQQPPQHSGGRELRTPSPK